MILIVIFLAMSSSSFAHNGTETLLHPWESYSWEEMVIDGNEDDWGWWYEWEEGPIKMVRWGQSGSPNNPQDSRSYFYLSTDRWGRLLIFIRFYDNSPKGEAIHDWWRDDVLVIHIDADHSGGPAWYSDGGEQNTYAMGFRPRSDAHPVSFQWNDGGSEPADWATQQGYTEFASKIDTVEDGSITCTYEIRTWVFNNFEFVPDEPSEEDFHSLEELGQTIGFSIALVDTGGEDFGFKEIWGIKEGGTGDLGDVINSGYAKFVEIREEDSSVRVTTWGSFKTAVNREK